MYGLAKFEDVGIGDAGVEEERMIELMMMMMMMWGAEECSRGIRRRGG